MLPNGFNVYPEDIENALRVAGIRDSVVVETQPGRIEAIVLGAASARRRRPPSSRRATDRCGGQGRQRELGPNQRIAGWRLWPEEDFPRTHTLKVKRGPVRAWVAADTALPVAGTAT